MNYKKEYKTRSGIVNFTELRKDFYTFLQLDEYLHFKFFHGLCEVVAILENRLFNHSCNSHDVKFLAFIKRNELELKVIL